MRVFLALGQSGVSNFALVRVKIKKNALCLNQSVTCNFALYVIRHLTRPLFLVKMAIQFNSAGDRGCSPGEDKHSTGAVKGKSNGDSKSNPVDDGDKELSIP